VTLEDDEAGIQIERYRYPAECEEGCSIPCANELLIMGKAPSRGLEAPGKGPCTSSMRACQFLHDRRTTLAG
jgi:hypothetical protein